MQWYFCLEHQQVEPEDGCANAERLGPYESEHAARRRLSAPLSATRPSTMTTMTERR